MSIRKPDGPDESPVGQPRDPNLSIPLANNNPGTTWVRLAFVSNIRLYDNGVAASLTILTEPLDVEQMPDPRGYPPIPGQPDKTMFISWEARDSDLSGSFNYDHPPNLLSAESSPTLTEIDTWEPFARHDSASGYLSLKINWPLANFVAQCAIPMTSTQAEVP